MAEQLRLEGRLVIIPDDDVISAVMVRPVFIGWIESYNRSPLKREAAPGRGLGFHFESLPPDFSLIDHDSIETGPFRIGQLGGDRIFDLLMVGGRLAPRVFQRPGFNARLKGPDFFHVEGWIGIRKESASLRPRNGRCGESPSGGASNNGVFTGGAVQTEAQQTVDEVVFLHEMTNGRIRLEFTGKQGFMGSSGPDGARLDIPGDIREETIARTRLGLEDSHDHYAGVARRPALDFQ